MAVKSSSSSHVRMMAAGACNFVYGSGKLKTKCIVKEALPLKNRQCRQFQRFLLSPMLLVLVDCTTDMFTKVTQLKALSQTDLHSLRYIDIEFDRTPKLSAKSAMWQTVRHVYQKSQGTASKFELEWDSAQTWVEVPTSLTFIQESTDDSTDGGASDTASQPQDDPKLMSHNIPASICDTFTTLAHLPSSGAIIPLDESTKLHHSSLESVPEARHNSLSAISPTAINGIISPAAPPMSPWTGVTPPLSTPSPRSATDFHITSREAALMRLFIQKIAPWADICDARSNFSTEVPSRAVQYPMVLKAVLCLSARLDAILSNMSDWEASEYHGQCIELLIAALAHPEDTYDDNLLITVVLLRMYEELERTSDEMCHFTGSNRLLNTMSKSASSGGIAEAVSWQFLRQAIFASIVQFECIHLDLGNYERSTVFQRRDDASYANIIIFLCAKIIQNYPKTHSMGIEDSVRQSLMESVDGWFNARPVTWHPLQYKDADPAADRPFPESWIMSPSAVVGLQYYHTCCIFLTLSNRHWGEPNDYELARRRRLEESAVASHVLQVIGLSISNETVENAYFMACHLLHRYGYTLRRPVEQRESVRFLERAEKVVGWRTAWMVRELENQWGELRRLNSMV
ncbi:hypothetical protein FE257_011634 [Aspergillus nanangensis]|uniref:Zn(II)2Cys6 transcription factor n=1 Tax=Aspergillus nanangensis TaxID=2582783 RepID=A0AAD4CVA7_ASPNN|nr:hypothetical protein FE257_011634 [Aspergillus nanangensis]